MKLDRAMDWFGWSKVGVVPAAIFAIFVALTGGGSRSDILSLVVLRPVAVLMIAYALISGSKGDFRSLRVPLMILGSSIAIAAIQLIPLPSEIWSLLPARQAAMDVFHTANLEPGWLPISMFPSTTWNSFFAFAVPLAAILLVSRVAPADREKLVMVFLGIGMFSMMLGFVQLMLGERSSTYLYRITTVRSAVGIFANRNHHAIFLACMIPLLTTQAMLSVRRRHVSALKFFIYILLVALIVACVVATGSRTGLVLSCIAFTSCFLLVPRRGDSLRLVQFGVARIRHFYILLSFCVALFGIVTVFVSQSESVQRLLGENLASDYRFKNLPQVLDMVKAFFPVGGGLGTFGDVYGRFEANDSVTYFFFNHAHNDIIEYIYEAGVAGFIIVTSSLFLLIFRIIKEFRVKSISFNETILSRCGLIVVSLIILGSFVDYPLRTPFMAVLFVMSLGMIETEARQSPHRSIR